MEAMMQFYDICQDFRNYVDKYMAKHDIEYVEDALNMATVRDAYKYYLDIFSRRVEV